MTRRVAFAWFVVAVSPIPLAPAQDAPRTARATPQAPSVAGAAPALAARPPDLRPPPPPVPMPVPAVAKPPVERAALPPRRTAADSTAKRDPLEVPGRFANPGGVGRYAEYYTANTPTSQRDLHPKPPVRFDRGGGPDRASQVAAFQAGQMRTRNIQNNINAYGRPYGAYGAGFGYGFGLYGGGLYGGGFR